MHTLVLVMGITQATSWEGAKINGCMGNTEDVAA
jgi:hypothetical protein